MCARITAAEGLDSVCSSFAITLMRVVMDQCRLLYLCVHAFVSMSVSICVRAYIYLYLDNLCICLYVCVHVCVQPTATGGGVGGLAYSRLGEDSGEMGR